MGQASGLPAGGSGRPKVCAWAGRDPRHGAIRARPGTRPAGSVGRRVLQPLDGEHRLGGLPRPPRRRARPPSSGRLPDRRRERLDPLPRQPRTGPTRRPLPCPERQATGPARRSAAARSTPSRTASTAGVEAASRAGCSRRPRRSPWRRPVVSPAARPPRSARRGRERWTGGEAAAAGVPLAALPSASEKIRRPFGPCSRRDGRRVPARAGSARGRGGRAGAGPPRRHRGSFLAPRVSGRGRRGPFLATIRA